MSERATCHPKDYEDSRSKERYDMADLRAIFAAKRENKWETNAGVALRRCTGFGRG
jgi:hypothetical protein